MNPLRTLWYRLRAILGRRTLEQDMQAEMRDHVALATERYRARGMSLHDAHAAARKEFGNRTALEEDARDARGSRWVDALAGDLRFAFRYFARHKATVAIIVAVLSLGTGANALIFSVFRAEFLRPAKGVPDLDEHARFYIQERPTQGGRFQYSRFSHSDLVTLASRRDILRDATGWTIDDVVFDGQASDSADAHTLETHFVTPNYFRVVGVPLAAGQGFAQTGDQDLTAVLAYNIAVQLYDSAAAAIGRRVLVNELPVRIVGVAPPRFEGAIRFDDGMLWMPMSARAPVLRIDPRWMEKDPAVGILGRLAPGASHEQATAFAQQVVTASLPDSAARIGMARIASVQSMTGPPPGNDRYEMLLALVGLGSVGVLILLIAWMNVSSLMVAAAVARRHEIAVRLSLGATRLRLLRQLVTESTVLAVLGGALGLTLGTWVMMWLAKQDPNGLDTLDLMPDAGTLAFIVLLSVITGIIFGLSPALHATRGVATTLRDSGAATTTRSRLQRFFVGAQIVLSQPLLLLLGVILSMVVADYKPHAEEMSRRVITVSLQPLFRTGAASQRHEAVDELVPRIAARPEVAGVAQEATGFDIRGIVLPDSKTPADSSAPRILGLEGTAPGWFDVVEVPIILGRDVQLSDTVGAERNVVIGSDLARVLFGNESPLGKRLFSPPLAGTNAASDTARLTVVGVYDATKALPAMTWQGYAASGDQHPRVYTAWGKAWRRDRILVKTHAPAAPYIAELQKLLRKEAPSIPVTRVMTLAQVDEQEYAVTLRMSALAGAGGFVALLLASLGLYGVVSLAVRQRTREIGIRIAVGAHPDRVARMFLLSGVRVSVIALLIGLPLSVIALKIGISKGAVLGVDVNPYLIGSVIALILLAVATAATWIPARRAARVDPATTLRVE